MRTTVERVPPRTPRTDPAFRCGLFVAWNEQCAWCTVPLRFSDLQIDHVIPKSLSGKALAECLALHSLAPDYDREASYNLVPACAKCNGPGGKGWKTPPRTPAISLLLQKALVRGEDAEADAQVLVSANRFSKSLTKVNAVLGSDEADQLTSSERDALELNAYLTRRWLNERAQRERAERSIFRSYHEVEAPYIVEVTAHVEVDDFLAMLQDWFVGSPDLASFLRTFTGDEDNRPVDASPYSIEQLAWAPQLRAYLARVTLSVEYLHTDSEGNEGPHEPEPLGFDLWLRLTENETEVLDVEYDVHNSFPD